MHAPGAEGAPLLASDLEPTLVKPPLGRADRVRVSSARLFGGVAIALLVACVGAVGSIAVAARASGGAGAVVTSASALGSVNDAVDPMEASGARPMSAYGTIDRNSPVMRDLAAGEDPVDRAAAEFLEDATLGEREEPAAARDEKDAAPRDAPIPTQNTQQQPQNAQPRNAQPSSPARSVQDDVDDQIEIEMRRLDEAARAMDAERAAARRARENERETLEPTDAAARGAEDEPARRSIAPRVGETALLAGGKRKGSSKRDRRSRDDPKDKAPAKNEAPAEDEAPKTEDDARKAPRPVVSEVKDGYARAIDAALASGSIGASEGVSSDLSSLNVLEPEPSASSNEGVRSSGVSAGVSGVPVSSGACDFSKCDAAAGPQVVDLSCVSMGGLGCIGQTGCRFCKAGLIGERGLATCPPCVCQAMGVTGCGDASEIDADDVFQSSGVGKAEATTATTASTTDFDFDDGVPVDAAERVIAAPTALTTEGAVVAPPEALRRPEDDVADAATASSASIDSAFSVAGVAWLLTPFGYLETCEQRCARAKMRCDDTKFPTTFQDFVSVVGATNPEPGRDDVCASVLETDPSRHCVFPLYALSGRCYQQPARQASCVTAEDAHADCQHFCPCVK